MIRFILTFGFLVVFLIVTIPVRGIEHIIGKFNPELRDKSSLAIVNWAFRCCIFTSGVKVDYIGLEMFQRTYRLCMSEITEATLTLS